jgi:hypothetical protein
MKVNREVVMTAVRQSPDALSYLADAMKADKDVVLAAVSKDGNALGYASAELKADREVVLAAVRSTGISLGYASAELKADRGIVLAAVRQNGDALLIGHTFRNDKEIVLTSVSKQNTLEYASPELKADRQVVLAAVTKNGDALEHASPELHADREVVWTAIHENGTALQWASPPLQRDPELIVISFLRGLVMTDEQEALATPYAERHLGSASLFKLQSLLFYERAASTGAVARQTHPLQKLMNHGPRVGKHLVKLTSSFAGTEEPAKYTKKGGYRKRRRTNRINRVYR